MRVIRKGDTGKEGTSRAKISVYDKMRRTKTFYAFYRMAFSFVAHKYKTTLAVYNYTIIKGFVKHF